MTDLYFMRRSSGFQSNTWSTGASTSGRWCASLFAKPCDKYQPFEVNPKIGYKADNWPLPSSLQRKTAAANRIYPLEVRAYLMVAFKIFAGPMHMDMSIFFSSPHSPHQRTKFLSFSVLTSESLP